MDWKPRLRNKIEASIIKRFISWIFEKAKKRGYRNARTISITNKKYKRTQSLLYEVERWWAKAINFTTHPKYFSINADSYDHYYVYKRWAKIAEN